MKKVILGSIMFLSGTLAAAIILAGAMANELNVNGRLSAIWNITQYGLILQLLFFLLLPLLDCSLLCGEYLKINSNKFRSNRLIFQADFFAVNERRANKCTEKIP